MSVMKTGLLVDLHRKLGEGPGLLDAHKDANNAARIRAALDILADVQKGWKAKGLTQAEIRKMARQGRA